MKGFAGGVEKLCVSMRREGGVFDFLRLRGTADGRAASGVRVCVGAEKVTSFVGAVVDGIDGGVGEVVAEGCCSLKIEGWNA
jgi:hypothetical protein